MRPVGVWAAAARLLVALVVAALAASCQHLVPQAEQGLGGPERAGTIGGGDSTSGDGAGGNATDIDGAMASAGVPGTDDTPANTAESQPGETGSSASGDTATPPRKPAPTREAWDVRILASGSQSAVHVPVARLISDQATWVQVWNAIHSNVLPPPTAPEIDFSREEVVVLVLGDRPTAGYGIAVEQVNTTLRGTTISVRVTTPGDQLVAQVLTSPFQLSAIPIARRPVTFDGDDIELGYVGE